MQKTKYREKEIREEISTHKLKWDRWGKSSTKTKCNYKEQGNRIGIDYSKKLLKCLKSIKALGILDEKDSVIDDSCTIDTLGRDSTIEQNMHKLGLLESLVIRNQLLQLT